MSQNESGSRVSRKRGRVDVIVRAGLAPVRAGRGRAGACLPPGRESRRRWLTRSIASHRILQVDKVELQAGDDGLALTAAADIAAEDVVLSIPAALLFPTSVSQSSPVVDMIQNATIGSISRTSDLSVGLSSTNTSESRPISSVFAMFRMFSALLVQLHTKTAMSSSERTISRWRSNASIALLSSFLLQMARMTPRAFSAFA